jgi:hypothetical protein
MRSRVLYPYFATTYDTQGDFLARNTIGARYEFVERSGGTAGELHCQGTSGEPGRTENKGHEEATVALTGRRLKVLSARSTMISLSISF